MLNRAVPPYQALYNMEAPLKNLHRKPSQLPDTDISTVREAAKTNIKNITNEVSFSQTQELTMCMRETGERRDLPGRNYTLL